MTTRIDGGRGDGNAAAQGDPQRAPVHSFEGARLVRRLPNMELYVLESPSRPPRAARSTRHAGPSDDGGFVLCVLVRGEGVVLQEERVAVLAPGDFALCDAARRYMLQFSAPFEVVLMKIDRGPLERLLPDAAAHTATRVPGGGIPGQLAVGLVHTLAKDDARLEALAAGSVAAGLLNFLAAAFKARLQGQAAGLSPITTFHLDRVKSLVESRLRDSTLSVASLAAEAGLSMRHLQRLFAAERLGPKRYIWNRRLEACSEDLLDPARAGHSVRKIAYSWGFVHATHFSRAFKERFGCSPKEWRARARIDTEE